jgi:predicted HTH domain antitoxin
MKPPEKSTVARCLSPFLNHALFRDIKYNGIAAAIPLLIALRSEGDDRMVRMTIEMPEEAFAALRAGPEDFAQQLRLAAAAKWYEMRRVSQERAAKIAGLSRAEFIEALHKFGVSPFQSSAEEIA